MAKTVNAVGRLFVGTFGRRVYWAPRVKATPQGNGTAIFEVVGDQKDVTAMFEECARTLGWTPPQKSDALVENHHG